jgi:hypothetical protein
MADNFNVLVLEHLMHIQQQLDEIRNVLWRMPGAPPRPNPNHPDNPADLADRTERLRQRTNALLASPSSW